MRVAASPVKLVAQRAGIPVLQPPTLREAQQRDAVTAIDIDVLVVAAYGLLLPREVLGWPKRGCLNVHASLLPRWRGAAPIERAIEAGDARTGITVMQMDAGLDTGPIVSMVQTAIGPRETGGSLTEKLAVLGADAIVDALAGVASERRIAATPQPAEGVTYARKIEPKHAAIDWTTNARAIERKIRAFDPTPGAFGSLDGRRIKLWSADVVDDERRAEPGHVIAATPRGIDVACGEGTLRIIELQPDGRRRMSAAAFVAGHSLAADARFATAHFHGA